MAPKMKDGKSELFTFLFAPPRSLFGAETGNPYLAFRAETENSFGIHMEKGRGMIFAVLQNLFHSCLPIFVYIIGFFL